MKMKISMKNQMLLGMTLLLASCGTSQLPKSQPPTKPVSAITNLMEIRIEGATTARPTSTARVLGTPSDISKQGPVPISSGLSFKSLGATSFTINATGKRYISAVFQISNNTGRTLNNLGFVAVDLNDTDGNSSNNALSPTIGSTAFSKVKYYDGSDASSKATLLTAGPLYTYDIANNEADLDPTGPTFSDALDTSKILLDAPTGLSLSVLNFGWTVPGSFPTGTTKNATFSFSFDVSDDPTQDPFGFSLMAAFSEEPSDPFDITLDFSGDTLLTTSQKAIFELAATRWEQVITHGLTTVDVFGNIVDDLYIAASAANIDGVGGVLGQAGPEYIRSSNKLPITGTMQFDSSDIANMESNGTLYSVILHEMGHVLGIGTIWEEKSFLTFDQATCQTSNSIVFNGSNAVTQYGLLGGTGNVPVENTGGAGTKCGHWRESIFDSELMTGWAESGSMPLSRMTIASLKDLGYMVNLAAADTYTIPGGGIRQQSQGFELIEIPTKPVVVPGS